MKGGVKMAAILGERWDWWNEYTEKDKILDCLIVFSRKLGRWPTYKEVEEVWPEYNLCVLQNKFGSYDKAQSAAAEKIYYSQSGHCVRMRLDEVRLSRKQVKQIAEIAARPGITAREGAVRLEPVAREGVTRLEPVVREGVTRLETPMQAGAVAPMEEKSETTLKPTSGACDTVGSSANERPREKRRPGRRPTYSDAQLIGFVRKMVAANSGKVPTAKCAKEFLCEQPGAPSLMTLTNRLGPISSWERRLEEAG